MTRDRRVLLDTSAAIPLTLAASDEGEQVRAHVRGSILGLAGHAAFETYSVLTRLPGDLRVRPADAVMIIDHNFPESHVSSVALQVEARERLANAGISGGAVWDGLVALAAIEAGRTLVTRDQRAAATYERLGCEFELVR